MLLQKFLKFRLNFVRTAFRRKDTPAPAPDLAEKVLYNENRYMERESFPGEFAVVIPTGKIYDKKPFKIFLEVDREYKWCVCGTSKGQPMCDGSHSRLDGTEFIKMRPLFRPLTFKVTKSEDYYLCNCKKTSNPPYCDGTHKRADIQEAIKS